MKKEYYHQSIKFNKEELAYKKLMELQSTLHDTLGNKYPLTAIIKMAIMSFDKNSLGEK